MFLLPYSLSYHYLGFYGYLIFLFFFSILVIGFLIEWSVGMLVWKGEENSPTNAFKISEYEKKKTTLIRKYFLYTKLYLNLIDQQSLATFIATTQRFPKSFYF